MILIVDNVGNEVLAGALKFSGALSHRGNNVYSVSDMNLSRRESTATTTKDVTNWNVHERVSRPEDHQVSHIYDKTNVKRSGTVEKLTATVTHDKKEGIWERPGRTVTELIRSGTVDHRPTVTHLQQRGTVTRDRIVTHLSKEEEKANVRTTTRQYDVTEPRATYERVIETSIANTVTKTVTEWDSHVKTKHVNHYVTQWKELLESYSYFVEGGGTIASVAWESGGNCNGCLISVVTRIDWNDEDGTINYDVRILRFDTLGRLSCVYDKVGQSISTEPCPPEPAP